MKQLVFLVLCCIAVCPQAFSSSCESVASLKLSDGKIAMAAVESAGTVFGLTPEPIDHLPKFCRVSATLMPSSDSDIRIEVWMPVAGWNGKYEGTGNGGYAGSIAY